MRATTKCTESLCNLVVMVTYLYENINFGVDFLFLFVDLYLGLAYVSHINMLPYQTPGISNQALVFMRDAKMLP